MPLGVRITTVAVILAGLCCAMANAETRQVDDQLVVKMRPASRATAQALAREHGLAFKRRMLAPGMFVVHGGKDPEKVLARLRSNPDVLFATRNRYVELTETLPDDPGFPNQWHWRNTGQESGTPGADVRASLAWDVTTGSAQTVIAITDTGIDLAHLDFSNRLWVNPGEIVGNGIDDDSNGFVDDINGWSFWDNTNNVQGTNGHGTAVAGTAGARANNSYACAGMNWNARLMILSCFSGGNATEADLLDAVTYAAQNGANVINASWGSPEYSPLYEEMMEQCRAHNVLFVAAAGNYGADSDAYPFYPAALLNDALIGVGGSNRNDGWVYNYGLARVGVSAPAWDLTIPFLGGGYGRGSGTSYAAPIVSGLAGLLSGQDPTLAPEQIKYRIIGSADPVTSLSERNNASGRINSLAAVQTSDFTPPSAITNLAVDRNAHNGAVVKLTAPSDPGNAAPVLAYQVRVSTGPITAANFYSLPLTPPGAAPSLPGTQQHLLLNNLEPATAYNVAIRAVDRAGNAGPMTTTSLTTPARTDVFFDPCDSALPFWTASGGFALAESLAHTGCFTWQDSPGAGYPADMAATLTSGQINIATAIRPRLSFYLNYLFPSRVASPDRLEVQASIDAGATWTPLRKYQFTYTPFRREIVPLDDFKGAPDLRIRFLVVSNSDTYLSDGVYIDDIAVYDGDGAVPERTETMIHPNDFAGTPTPSPEFEQFPGTGTWTTEQGQHSQAPRVDSSYPMWATPGTAQASARYTPLITTPGVYEVSVTWGALANASQVTYEISTANGQTSRILNQSTANSHRWHVLGRFTFGYGRNPLTGSVLINAATATGPRAYADAVRFRLVEFDPALSGASDWTLFE